MTSDYYLTRTVSLESRHKTTGWTLQAAGLGCAETTEMVSHPPEPRQTQYADKVLWEHVGSLLNCCVVFTKLMNGEFFACSSSPFVNTEPAQQVLDWPPFGWHLWFWVKCFFHPTFWVDCYDAWFRHSYPPQAWVAKNFGDALTFHWVTSLGQIKCPCFITKYIHFSSCYHLTYVKFKHTKTPH